MPSTDWFERLQYVFHQSLSVDASTRDAYLDEACGDDAELRAEVESLLAAHAQADASWNASRSETGCNSEACFIGDEIGETPHRIGSYEIEGRLGSGGMGVVYQAVQRGTGQRVALKVIRSGLSSSSLLQRFEHEARILGRLRHPGIAQVFEAGVHEQGDVRVPFIAMELVEGDSLDEHFQQRRRPTSYCLKLLASICDAVHHAHLKGVVHRDLKPDNILIDTGADPPQPKILDFGIARLTDADVRLTTLQTHPGQLLGTMAYMSPEQAAGDPDEIDVRSDVYALGVLLYRMLTGRLPYQLDNRPIYEVVRIVREQEPVSPDSIVRTLRGDLATILGKALEKDRKRRYQSAAELAEDIRRYLGSEPIVAHPPSRFYQLRKFARRNRVFVTAALLVFVVLAAGVTTTSWQAVAARRARESESRARELAERRFGDVRSLAQSMIFDLSAKLTDVPGALEARRHLAETARQYLDRLAADSGEDADLDQELAVAYMRVGDLLGDPTRSNLGDMPGAIESYRKAIPLLQSCLGQQPTMAHETLSLAHCKIGDVLCRMNKIEDAMVEYQTARGLALAYSEGNPDSSRAQRHLSVVHDRYGRALMASGRGDEGSAEIALGWQIVEQLADKFPQDQQLRHDLAVQVFEEAERLRAAGRLADAVREYERQVSMLQSLLDSVSQSRSAMRDLATVLERIGRCEAERGDLTAAEATYARSIRIGEELAAADPDDVAARAALCAPYCWLGELQSRMNRPDDAYTSFERYLELAESVASAAPDNAAFRRDWGIANYKLGEWHASRAKAEQFDHDRRGEHWKAAQGYFLTSHNVFIDMRDRGLLGAGDLGVPDQVAVEIATCESAIREWATAIDRASASE